MDISRFREALRQGCIDPFAACVHWKDSPSPPPPPDYKGAAEAQQTNQITPFGSSTWTHAQDAIPGTGATPGHYEYGQTTTGAHGETIHGQQHWVEGTPGTGGSPAVTATNTTTLSPELQKGLMGITSGVANNLSKPQDFSSVGDIANKAYGAMTSRLDPQWGQQQNQQETQLRNQGLVPGGEAYDNAMRVFNNAKNDAYQQANLGAISTMPQTYQLAMAQRDQPLNELNAIRTGAQISGPQFEGSPNYLGASGMQGQYEQGLYNAQVGNANATNSGLFSLGAAGLMAL